MKYMILIYQDEAQVLARTPQETDVVRGAYMAYRKTLEDTGVFLSGAPLELSTTGTTIQVRNDTRSVQDGPYADTKEQFAGFFIIECPDLDSALEWAAKCPGVHLGVVEVRPVAEIVHK